MCGFVGIFNSQAGPVSPREIFSMCDLVAHRGPDDSGYLFIETATGKTVASLERDRKRLEKKPPRSNLAFGHRRLSIIDLSDKAHQPMRSQDGSIWLVFNGALYNYIELREELKTAGYRFTSDSDTEVIIHAYRHWGKECLHRFNGMWAFALWDGKKKQLFMARDRMGIKPLYYHFQDDRIIFASEIKSLLEAGGVKREPEDEMVFDFLLWGIKDHSEKTFFKNINQLKPGELMIVSADGAPSLERYYRLQHTRDIGRYNQHRNSHLSEKLLYLMEDAVRLRLRSDVPVGFCLSGGIDSSAISCLAHRLVNNSPQRTEKGQYRTFTFGNKEQAFDERPFAAMVSSKLSFENQYIYVKHDRFWDDIDRVLWHQDEPFYSTSIYAQYRVSQAVRDTGTTVLLDGQGADELFAGYGGYYEQLLAQLLREGSLPRFLSKLVSGSKNMEAGSLKILNRVLRLLNPLASHPLFSRSRQRLGLINNTFIKRHAQREKIIREKRDPGKIQDRLFQDVTTFNMPQLLHYADRNAMTFAIEGRYPFLDYRIVEFALALPAVYKQRDGCSKYILRNAMTDLVPQAILDRRDKMGFVTPEAMWLRRNKDTIKDLFHPDTVRGERFLDVHRINRSFDDLFTDRNLARMGLWKIIILEKWLRMWF